MFESSPGLLYWPKQRQISQTRIFNPTRSCWWQKPYTSAHSNHTIWVFKQFSRRVFDSLNLSMQVITVLLYCVILPLTASDNDSSTKGQGPAFRESQVLFLDWTIHQIESGFHQVHTNWTIKYVVSWGLLPTVVLSCGSERKKVHGIWPSPSLYTILSETEFIKIKKL